MQSNNLSEDFQREWEEYLRKQGHRVREPKGINRVLESRNGAKKNYRWLLIDARGKSKALNRAELEDMKYHLKRARSLNQKVYVVIHFQKPEPKVIVLPAERVLKGKRILPTKGGIPSGE